MPSNMTFGIFSGHKRTQKKTFSLIHIQFNQTDIGLTIIISITILKPFWKFFVKFLWRLIYCLACHAKWFYARDSKVPFKLIENFGKDWIIHVVVTLKVWTYCEWKELFDIAEFYFATLWHSTSVCYMQH